MIIEVYNEYGKKCKIDSDFVIKSDRVILEDDSINYKLETVDGNLYWIEENDYNDLVQFYNIF